MADYTSLSVKDSTKDRIDDLQPEDMSRDEFVQELLAHYDGDVNQEVSNGEPTFDEISNQLEGKFLSESQVQEIIKAEKKDVLNRLADLENSIPRKTAQEVRNG